MDYAQARYFSSKHGRFTSVDPLTASASIKNPQTFNRYSYGLNSPYKFTDSLGLKPCAVPGGGNTGCITEGEEAASGDCPPQCPDIAGTLGPGGNGLGTLVTVDISISAAIATAAVPIVEAVAPYVSTQIFARALEALPVLSAQIVAVPAAIVTLVPPGGSPCQIATADDFCGTNPSRNYQRDTQPQIEPFPVDPTTTGPSDDYTMVFHGSINNATQIQMSGLDPSRGITNVTRDRSAAENAIGNNRYDVSQGMARDPGIISSRIPTTLFNQHFGPYERPYSGFNGTLRGSSEILISQPIQYQIFNQYIVR